MRLLMFLLLIFSVIACSKPNPNPELADEIYLDLDGQAQSAQKEFESEKKKLEDLKKDMDNAKPQTGENKYAEKRYFEAEQKVEKLEQQYKYFSLQAESRKQYTKKNYLKAFSDGKTWPTAEEVEDYKKYKQLSKVDPNWSEKKRIEEYEKQNAPKAGPAGEGGAKKEEEIPKKQ